MAGTGARKGPASPQKPRPTPHLDRRPDAELTEEERDFRDKWDREFGPQRGFSAVQGRIIGFAAIAAFVGIILFAVLSA